MSGSLTKFLLLAACVLSGGAPALAATLQVFAAASLTDSLRRIATMYESSTGGKVKVLFNFGASSLLARQIEEGAPADIFFSADEAKMDHLQQQGLILEGTRKNRLSNALAIVVTADSKLQIRTARDLIKPDIQRLALADPKAVPAGIYAKTYLESLKLWQAASPKVIPTDNVRAALAAVESGNVDAAIVYRTDAAISPKVKIAYAVPPDAGPPIRYPMAVVKGTRQRETSKDFLRYLASDAAGGIFQRYGFIVLDRP